jgi:uncharacterized protein (DUF433 family)
MANRPYDYRDRIRTDPQILVGKPTVKGTRIAVELILEYLAQNPSLEDLFTDYPELTLDDVKACLAYARALTAGEAVTPSPPVAARGRAVRQPA